MKTREDTIDDFLNQKTPEEIFDCLEAVLDDWNDSSVESDILMNMSEGVLAYVGSGWSSCSPFNQIEIESLFSSNNNCREVTGGYKDSNGKRLFDFEVAISFSKNELLRIEEPYKLVPRKKYRTRYYFAPNINATSIERKYIESPKVQDEAGKMNYDFYFSPTTEIKDHYRKYAKSIKCIIQSESIEVEE